jgi:selenocysteine lyase/cysteine desulfurase
MLIQNQSFLFDIPNDINYLNCSYMAPSLKSVSEAGEKAVRLKGTPWEIKAEDFFTSVSALKERFAKIISSKKGHIAIIPSVSYGIETAIKNIDLKETDTILLLKDQFPSNVYPWIEKAKSVGAKVTFLEKNEGTWTDTVLNALNPSVKVLALPNVHWTNGARLNLEKINKKRKEIGAYLILDLTQSCGALPFSVKNIDADFIVAAAYKWLLGPYSLSYLYVSEDFHNGKPLENNWINRKDSQNFSQLLNYKDEYQSGAERFDMGEKSNFISVAMANVALEQILNWGIEEISESLKILTNHIINLSNELNLKTLIKEEQSPHMTGITFENGVPNKLLADLKVNNFFISVRGNSIRVAPHLYNSRDQIDEFFSIIKKHL